MTAEQQGSSVNFVDTIPSRVEGECYTDLDSFHSVEIGCSLGASFPMSFAGIRSGSHELFPKESERGCRLQDGRVNIYKKTKVDIEGMAVQSEKDCTVPREIVRAYSGVAHRSFPRNCTFSLLSPAPSPSIMDHSPRNTLAPLELVTQYTTPGLFSFPLEPP
jgi:hypothetical protein